MTPRNADGKVDFAMALQMGDKALIQQALNDGADINQKAAAGQTPLLNSVLRDNTDLIEILLELGADPTVTEENDYTILDLVGFQGRHNSLKTLAKHMDREVFNTIMEKQHTADGEYPIHRACRGDHKNHAKTVRAFLVMGVNLELETRQGLTCEEMTSNPHTKRVIEKYKDWERKKSGEL